MVRRLHDVGKSGAMVFVALIPLIGPIWMIALLAKEGEPNINQYGPNPKESGLEVTEQWTSSNAYKDTVLIITVVWLVIDRLWWGVIPEYVEDWFYNDWIFQVGRVISLFQAFVPLGLASLIKNKALRITFFVLGGIYSLHVLYVIIRPFM